MSREHIRELMAEAAALPNGQKRKTELIEEAVREADADNLDDVAYDARMKLLPAANWSGDVDKMLIAFAWCVAKYDEEPSKHSPSSILWYSKWAALEAPRFPSVSRARIAQLLDDTERRFRDHNASLRPVFQHRHYAAVELGDIADARAHYERWWREPRDSFADCAACETSAKLDWALVLDDDEQAVDVAESMFKARMTCAEVPHRIYGLTLASLLRLGRVDEALSAHRVGIRMLGKLEHNMSIDVAHHASFLAVTGNLGPALRIINAQLPQAAAHRLPSTRAHVFTDACVVADRLVAAGKARAKLVVVDGIKNVPADARGRVDTAQFAAAAWAEATRISALYDVRNGNKSFTNALAKKRALSTFAVDAPLTPKAKSDAGAQ